MNDRLRLIGISAPPPAAMPPGLLRVRGRIGAAMLAAHAIGPEDAIPFTPDPGDAAAFARLRADGVVREVGGGRFWFDLVAYHLREQARGRVYAIWGFGLALAGAALAMLFYWI